ncbi:hypothetical protein E1B77_09940 [Salmonella enterica subsp. enterica]|nr:hypothetical protein [Salmonella enterica subsp. enterica]
MLFDQQNIFSDNQAISNTGSTISTNTIDVGTASDMGACGDIPIAVVVTEAFNNLTSLAINIQTASSENFADGVDVATITVPKSALVQGYIGSIITLPMNLKRYIRLHYSVTGTAPTTGKVLAGICGGVQTNG